MDVKMNDWESVVSKDKKEEWLTDSADFIDDLQPKDSKIIRLSEYTRTIH